MWIPRWQSNIIQQSMNTIQHEDEMKADDEKTDHLYEGFSDIATTNGGLGVGVARRVEVTESYVAYYNFGESIVPVVCLFACQFISLSLSLSRANKTLVCKEGWKHIKTVSS